MPKFPVDALKKRVVKAFLTSGVSPCPRARAYCDGSRKYRWHTDSTDDAQSYSDQRLNVENDLHTSEYPAKRLPEGL